MKEAISLVLATINDLPFIIEVYNQSIPDGLATADHQPITIKERENWFNAHNAEKHPLWIILKEGVPAGWLSFNKFYDRQAYEGVIEISLYLHKAYQGQKIGKFCLDLAIIEARKRHHHTILALIFAHNTISLRLFEDAHFVKWGHFPSVADMPGGWRDLLIYGLKVSPNYTPDIK